MKKKRGAAPGGKWRIPPPTPAGLPDPVDGKWLAALARRACARLAKDGTKTIAGAPASEPGQAVSALMTQFYAKAKTLPGFLVAPEYLESLDLIDISEAQEAMKDKDSFTPVMQSYLDSLPNVLYAFVPCFSQGVLAISGNDRYVFRVKDMDGEFLWLDIDKLFRAEDGTVLVTSRYAARLDAHMLPDGIALGIQLDGRATEGTLDKYVAIKPADLGWGGPEQYLWRSAVLQYAVDLAADAARRDDTPERRTVESVALGFCVANLYMSRYRPVIQKRPSGKRTDARPTNGKPAAAGPKVRRFGTVIVKSRARPRPAGAVKDPRWTIPSWTVAGHVRHYANGKAVYVKPSVHRRKALAGTDAAPARAVVEIKDNVHAKGD